MFKNSELITEESAIEKNKDQTVILLWNVEDKDEGEKQKLFSS